nr:hypothetical protein [Tanacetum cinerariifolium]
MSESAKRHEVNSNLIKEIRASMDAVVRNQRASIKTLEIQIGQVSKVLQERGVGSLPSSTEANPRDQVKSISTTIEADSCPIRRIGSAQYIVSTRQNRTLMYETRQMTIPFLSRLNVYYCKENKGSRNQGEDLMPTIKEGKVIEEFRTRDEDLDTGINDYPSYCDYDKKIHIDYAYHNEVTCDVIIGELFLKEVGIKARQIEGTITLYKDDKSVFQYGVFHLMDTAYQSPVQFD